MGRKLSLYLRGNRLESSDMNPFAERVNPLSLSAGNPDLKPEKIHSVEAGWLWHNDTNASLMTTVYYRYLTNRITEVSRYIDGGVLLTTISRVSIFPYWLRLPICLIPIGSRIRLIHPN